MNYIKLIWSSVLFLFAVALALFYTIQFSKVIAQISEWRKQEHDEISKYELRDLLIQFLLLTIDSVFVFSMLFILIGFMF